MRRIETLPAPHSTPNLTCRQFVERAYDILYVAVGHRRKYGDRKTTRIIPLGSLEPLVAITGAVIRLEVHRKIVHLAAHSPRPQLLHEAASGGPDQLEINENDVEMPAVGPRMGHWPDRGSERRQKLIVARGNL